MNVTAVLNFDFAASSPRFLNKAWTVCNYAGGVSSCFWSGGNKRHYVFGVNHEVVLQVELHRVSHVGVRQRRQGEGEEYKRPRQFGALPASVSCEAVLCNGCVRLSGQLQRQSSPGTGPLRPSAGRLAYASVWVRRQCSESLYSHPLFLPRCSRCRSVRPVRTCNCRNRHSGASSRPCDPRKSCRRILGRPILSCMVTRWRVMRPRVTTHPHGLRPSPLFPHYLPSAFF